MRVMQTQLMDLFTIMECHFQRSIKRAVNIAVHVTVNSGESEYQSSCAYYYSFLFSGWWFNIDEHCTYVALNGKYNTMQSSGLGFIWYNQELGDSYPNRSEMKIRRK